MYDPENDERIDNGDSAVVSRKASAKFVERFNKLIRRKHYGNEPEPEPKPEPMQTHELPEHKPESIVSDDAIRTLKLAVGAQHGLPPELSERLLGDTMDDLVADAKVLAGMYQPEPKRGPAVSLDGGAHGTPVEDDMNSIIRRDAGRLG